jgi:nucleoside-diphosphate-sugar epimerase
MITKDFMSGSFLKAILTGDAPELQNMKIPVVDVRDVATAHVLAIKTPEAANQRIILSNETMWV